MKTFTWRIKKLLKAQFKWLGYHVRATLQLTIGGKSKSNGRIQGGRASPSPLKKNQNTPLAHRLTKTLLLFHGILINKFLHCFLVSS